MGWEDVWSGLGGCVGCAVDDLFSEEAGSIAREPHAASWDVVVYLRLVWMIWAKHSCPHICISRIII